MNPGNQKLKTPIQLLIERLEATAKWARTDDEAKLFKLMAEECRKALPEERAHIENSWRDGAQGVKHQSSAQYFIDTYEIK